MYLNALIQRHQNSTQVARATSAYAQHVAMQQQAAPFMPSPAAAVAPQVEPPQEVAAAKKGRPSIGGRALGKIGGAGKAQTRMPSQLPPGTHMRVGAGKTPVVSPQVASLMDTYSGLDEIQNQVSALRRVASLYARGFTKSNQTKVVIPPNYNGVAYSAGAVPPQPAAIVTTASGSNLTSPAAMQNEAQGEMIGKSGPNPLQHFAGKVAQAASVVEAPPAPVVAVNARAPAGGFAAGTAADQTLPETYAKQVGAEVAVETATAQPTFEAASAGMSAMFGGRAPRKSALKQR